MRTLIEGGQIVNEGRCFDGSIVIEDEKIIEILKKGQHPEAPVDKTIDATGCFVLPGIIDTHVHFREPGMTEKADIDSESCAAAAGGVTSYFEMPNTVPQTTTLEALEDKFQRAAKSSHVNYTFFFGATNDNVALFDKLDVHRIPGIKLFMGSSTGNMLVDRDDALNRIFQTAKLPIMAHCEDTAIINKNMEEAKKAWGNDPQVSLHALIRSESFFDADVISSAGAIGLTQLMSPTAGEIAQKLRIKEYSLTDPETNIMFGTYYLSELIRRGDGSLLRAFFSYNAGFRKVTTWLNSSMMEFGKAGNLDMDLFLETIPVSETREYGRKLVSATIMYEYLYENASFVQTVQNLLK